MVHGVRPRFKAPLHGGAFAVFVLVALNAHAFERAKNELNHPFSWKKARVTVGLGDVSASGFPPEVVRGALERAAATWSAAGCGISLLAASGAPDITLAFVPELLQKKAADTVREADRHTGDLTLARIDLSAAWPWGAQSPLPEDALDLETLVLHELGHALGLAHSWDRRAIMRAGAKPLRVRRALTPDDARGLCAIYPPT